MNRIIKGNSTYKKKSCSSKKRFNNRERAKMASRTIRRQGANSKHMRVYECEYCNGYHLASY